MTKVRTGATRIFLSASLAVLSASVLLHMALVSQANAQGLVNCKTKRVTTPFATFNVTRCEEPCTIDTEGEQGRIEVEHCRVCVAIATAPFVCRPS
jgi:hypothetical protein